MQLEMIPQILSFCCWLAFWTTNKIYVSLTDWKGFCMLDYIEVVLQGDVCRGQLCIYSVKPGDKMGPLPRNTRYRCVWLHLRLLHE